MTNAEIIAYYANLLILQYRGQPKAYATISALVDPIVMDQLPVAVQNAFNLIDGTGTAIGKQLDTLGKYAGVIRSGNGFSGPIVLDDSDFLTLIQIAILTNSAGSSLATIQNLLAEFFPDEILVFDYQNMQMSYLISSTIGSQDLAQLVVTEGLLPKPMGVSLATVIYAPVITDFFGMTDARLYELTHEIQANATPFNDAADYQMDWPWMDARYAIGPHFQQILITESGDILTTESGDPLALG